MGQHATWEGDTDAVIREADPAQPEPFIELYHECFGSMVRLNVRSLTGSKALAEDLVQDAFVRLHARWSRVQEPRPYLKRAVVERVWFCPAPAGS